MYRLYRKHIAPYNFKEKIKIIYSAYKELYGVVPTTFEINLILKKRFGNFKHYKMIKEHKFTILCDSRKQQYQAVLAESFDSQYSNTILDYGFIASGFTIKNCTKTCPICLENNPNEIKIKLIHEL